MEEIEIQTDGDIQSAGRRKQFADLVVENQKLIEENTKLTKKTAKDAAENKKVLKEILDTLKGDKK